MPWLSRNDFVPSDKLHADDLNNLANDQRTWGGDVNGGGYTLSNVHIIEAVPRAGGQVTSVFGRTGDVVAQAGDYTAALVGAVPTVRQILTPTGSGLSGGGPLSGDLTLSAAVKSVFTRTGDITLTNTDIGNAGGVVKTQQIITPAGSGLTGGGNLSGNLTLSVVPDTTNQQIQCMSQGSPVGSPRHAINFVSGTGALVTVQEISASNRIDVTVASTGTGGGMVDPTQIVGDLIVRGLTAPPTRLPVGADGQVLTADHLQALGVKWAAPANVGQVSSVFNRMGAVVQVSGDYTAAQVTNAVDQTGSYVNPPWIASLPWSKVTNPPAFLVDPTTAKGDLIVHGATTTKLPVGADGNILTADSSVALGMRWMGLPVTSVFGRAGGAVVAQAGDYTVAQVTGAVANTLTINTGTGLTGGGNLSGNRTISVVPDTTNQQIQVLLAGAVVGTRHAINFVNGANVSLSISDNVGSNQIDLTVSSTGGAGGMVDPTTAIGDLIVRGATAVQRLGVGLNGQVLTSDNTQLLGVRWAPATAGGGGSQSPWLTDIDAAGKKLNNVANIGVNVASGTARVYVLASGSEDGFQTVNHSAAGMAAASMINDVGDSVCIRSYGSGFVGPLPGLATLEASNTLAILATGAEVMRLRSGHVLIGTTTDDGLNALQVNGKVKSKSGGFVFPDNTVQTTAYTAAGSPVTSVFTRTGAIIAQAGDYTAALVTNAVDSSSTYNNPVWITSLAWSKITGAPALLTDPTTTKGDLIVRGNAAPATRFPVGTTNGMVLTVDSTDATFGVKWAAVTAVLPGGSNGQVQFNSAGSFAGSANLFWDAANNQLGIGTASPQAPLSVRGTNGGNVGNAAYFGMSADALNGVVIARAAPQANPMELQLGVNQASLYASIQVARGGVGYNLPLALQSSGGNVGIGTTGTGAPSPRLETFGVGGAPATSGTSQASGSLRISRAGGSNVLDMGSYTTPPFGLWLQGCDYANLATTYPIVMQPNGGNVGIGNDATGLAFSGYPQLLVGPTINTGKSGLFMCCGNATAAGVPVGSFSGVNFAISATEKRIGEVRFDVGSTVDTGYIVFNNWVAGVAYERIRIAPNGAVGIGTPSPNVDCHLFRSGIYAQMKLESDTSGDTGYIVKDSVREYKLGINIGAQGVGQFQIWGSTTGKTMLSCTDSNVGILKASPGYPLDVAGDVNCSGVFRQSGAQIIWGTSVGASAGLTLGATADVPGLSITVPQSGRYFIITSVQILNSGDINNLARIYLNYAGTIHPYFADYGTGAGSGSQGTLTMQWHVVISAGQLIKIQAAKISGPSCQVGTASSLTVHWMGNN